MAPPEPSPAVNLLDHSPDTSEWIPIPLEELLRQIQSLPQPVAVPRASGAWMTVPLAAVLAGLAAGWQWFGFRMIAASAIDPLPATMTMLAVIALLAAAAGPWLPLKALPSMGRWLERQPPADNHEQGGSARSWLRRVVREPDESLLWTAVAILAAAAGGMALLMILLAGPFTSLYQYLLDHFFWTDGALASLEWLGTLIATAPMWVLNGLVAAAIVLAAARRWPLPQAGAATAIGGVIGWALADTSHQQWTDGGLSSEQQILLGILPMFLLTGLAVFMSHDSARSKEDRESTEIDAPETGQGDEHLIWLALLVWAVGTGVAFAGWLGGRDLEAVWSGPRGANVGSGYPLLAAAGGMVGWLSVRHRTPRGPGCGMAIWIAGLGAGLAATLSSHWPSSPAFLRSAVLAGPAGYALAYAQTAWLARAGRRGRALAQMGAALLGGLAGGLAAGTWVAMPLLGPVGSMAAGALVLLAFGGLAQIFAHAQSGSTRYLRIGLIFASLTAAISIFPSDVRHWSQSCSSRVTAAASAVEPAWLIAQAPTGAKRFCAVGSETYRLLESPALVALSFPFPPAPADAGYGTQRIFPNACQALRQEHAVYDFIYQQGPLPAVGPRNPGYSREWLRRLARHRASGGRVMLDVALAGLNAKSAATIAHTFEQAMNSPCVWQLARMNGRPVLRLRTEGADEPIAPGWQPVQELLADERATSIHSLRRDAISRALRADCSPDHPLALEANVHPGQ